METLKFTKIHFVELILLLKKENILKEGNKKEMHSYMPNVTFFFFQLSAASRGWI